MNQRFDLYQVLLHTLLIGLAAMVVFLVRENRELRGLDAPPPPQVAEGDRLEAVPVRDLAGGEETLRFAGAEKERLLFIFTTTCPVCVTNQDAWRTVYERANNRFDIVGVSLSPAEETLTYRNDKELPFRVVVPEDIRGFAMEHASQVPLTVRVGRDGVVRGTWLGCSPRRQSRNWQALLLRGVE